MDLQLTTEQLQLRDATRRLLAARLEALTARLPEPPVHDPQQALKDALDLGWLGLGLPEGVGGAGDFADLAVVHEELGRGLAPSLVTSLTVAGRLLLRSGASSELLARLVSGDAIVVPVLGDPGQVAAESGRLTGSCRNVVDAGAASHLLVVARDASGAAVLALVDAGTTGVHVTEEASASDLPQGRVDLDDVVAELVTPQPADVLPAVQVEAVVLAAARGVGGGRAVLERTVDHVRTRHQFDRPIGTFQSVQHQLSDVATALDGAGLAVARAAWAVAAGLDRDKVATAAATAGLAAGEAFAHATLTAHQLHGGMGFVLDSPLHLWSARAVADPTTPATRRELLELRACASGLPADGQLSAPPHHRRVATPA